MFVALVIHHAMRMCRIVICGMSRYTKVFQIILYTVPYSKKKSFRTKNACFDFLCNFVWNISHSKKKSVRYDQNCKSTFM